jgi:hypothetical protein
MDGTMDGKAAHLTDWSGTSPLPARWSDALRHTGGVACAPRLTR